MCACVPVCACTPVVMVQLNSTQPNPTCKVVGSLTDRQLLSLVFHPSSLPCPHFALTPFFSPFFPHSLYSYSFLTLVTLFTLPSTYIHHPLATTSESQMESIQEQPRRSLDHSSHPGASSSPTRRRKTDQSAVSHTYPPFPHS